MKKAITAAAFVLIGALALSAAPADVTYAEGDASIKLKTGKLQDAQIGDTLNTGDTLRTGKDGLAELDQKGVSIKIAKNTVFTLMEREQGGQTSSVLSVTLGSIKFRYNKLTGQEPMVRTNSMVAGVRGTEFSVFSGDDGSTLIAVDSGQVTVESEGKSVDLAATEGVEVPLGKPPGDKFTVPRELMDYSRWNEDKLSAMLADPLAAMTSIESSLAEYEKNVADYNATYLEYKARLDAKRQKRLQISKEQGADEAAKYQQEVITPLSLQTGRLFLNARYFSLAALSMRRFVAGRLYVLLKSRYITNPGDPTWTQFLSRFDNFLSSFEQSIAPQLVVADI
ncbi:MAG: FecR family protein [Spirochaetia bacterium]|jgi:hypothetical protein